MSGHSVAVDRSLAPYTSAAPPRRLSACYETIESIDRHGVRAGGAPGAPLNLPPRPEQPNPSVYPSMHQQSVGPG